MLMTKARFHRKPVDLNNSFLMFSLSLSYFLRYIWSYLDISFLALTFSLQHSYFVYGTGFV